MHFSLDIDSLESDREKELAYVAFDTQLFENSLEEPVLRNGEVDIYAAIDERLRGEITIDKEVDGEIEVNSDFFLFKARTDKSNQDVRAAIIITAFLSNRSVD